MLLGHRALTSILTIADLNGDGLPDIVASAATSGTVNIYLGNIDGSFAAHRSFAGPTITWGVNHGDFNEDGVVDLIVNDSVTGGVLQLMVGNARTVTSMPYTDLFTAEGALAALTTLLDGLLERTLSERGAIGASMSRLSHTTAVLFDQYEQYRAAARITDIDVAEESAQLILRLLSA